jgi:hypothetical protein
MAKGVREGHWSCASSLRTEASCAALSQQRELGSCDTGLCTEDLSDGLGADEITDMIVSGEGFDPVTMRKELRRRCARLSWSGGSSGTHRERAPGYPGDLSLGPHCPLADEQRTVGGVGCTGCRTPALAAGSG